MEQIFSQMALAIICVGLIGNTLGILSFINKRIIKTKIDPRYIYIFLFLIDSTALTNLVIIYLIIKWQINLTIISDIANFTDICIQYSMTCRFIYWFTFH